MNSLIIWAYIIISYIVMLIYYGYKWRGDVNDLEQQEGWFILFSPLFAILIPLWLLIINIFKFGGTIRKKREKKLEDKEISWRDRLENDE